MVFGRGRYYFNRPHEVYEVLRNHGVVQTEVKAITEAVKPQ